MANYFSRRALRIQNVPESLGKKVVDRINKLIQLEEPKVILNSVYIYIPLQLKNFVRKKTLCTLNSFRDEQTRCFRYEDMELKSTIVVITNIPDELESSDMDIVLKKYGSTLTNFQFIKSQTTKTPLKYGWVVFADLFAAEECEKELNGMKLQDNYLEASILPDQITNESSLKELFTLQIEGFPKHFCNNDKIKQLISIIIPHWPGNEVTYIKTHTVLTSPSKPRYIAVVDWQTREAALTGFKCLNKFTTTLHGEILVDINACFKLPGVTALSQLQYDTNRQNATTIEGRSPPPYCRETSSGVPPSYSEATLNNVPPPPYSPPILNHIGHTRPVNLLPPGLFPAQQQAFLALAAQQQLNAMQQFRGLSILPTPHMTPLMACRPMLRHSLTNTHINNGIHQQSRSNNFLSTTNNRSSTNGNIHLANSDTRSKKVVGKSLVAIKEESTGAPHTNHRDLVENKPPQECIESAKPNRIESIVETSEFHPDPASFTEKPCENGDVSSIEVAPTCEQIEVVPTCEEIESTLLKKTRSDTNHNGSNAESNIKNNTGENESPSTWNKVKPSKRWSANKKKVKLNCETVTSGYSDSFFRHVTVTEHRQENNEGSSPANTAHSVDEAPSEKIVVKKCRNKLRSNIPTKNNKYGKEDEEIPALHVLNTVIELTDEKFNFEEDYGKLIEVNNNDDIVNSSLLACVAGGKRHGRIKPLGMFGRLFEAPNV